MTRHRCGLVVMWCLLALLPACGARVAPVAPAWIETPHDNVAAVEKVERVRSSQDPRENGIAGGKQAAGDGTALSASPSTAGKVIDGEWANAEGAPQGGPVVRLRLSARCVEPGQALHALVQGPPRASVAMSATYEGSDEPGGRVIAATDDRGEFRWVVSVPPHVRPGAGWIGVAVTGPHRGRGGGVAQERFDVATPAGCRN